MKKSTSNKIVSFLFLCFKVETILKCAFSRHIHYRNIDCNFSSALDNRDTNLRTAKVLKGTCPDMCPETERYKREARRLLHPYEMLPTTGLSVSTTPPPPPGPLLENAYEPFKVHLQPNRPFLLIFVHVQIVLSMKPFGREAAFAFDAILTNP